MELKPVAYTIEQFGKVAFYTHDEFVRIPKRGKMLATGEAKPLYAIPEGYALVPIEAPIEAVAEMGFLGDVDLAIGHALISQQLGETYTKTIKAVMIKAGGVK